MKFRLTRPAIACGCYFILHLVAQLSAAHFEVAPGISVWYPPCGLALSLMVLLGARYAPVVFLANVVGALIQPGLTTWWGPIVFPALITVNYAVAAGLVRRAVGPKLLPGTVREAAVFALTIVGSAAGIAVMGSGLLYALGLSSVEVYTDSAIRWWIGDLSGLMTVVPAAMVFAGPWLQERPLGMAAKSIPRLASAVVAQATVLFACLWAVFALEPLLRYNAFYLCFLPLIWICLRHGLPGATLATLAITMGSLLGLHFTGTSTTTEIVGFLIFELTVTVVGLGLGSAVTRRNEAEQRLAASEARFDRAIEGAQMGLWDWDLEKQRIVYNRRYAEMLGRKIDEIEPAHAVLDQLVHPQDRERVIGALRAHLEGRSPLHEVEYRILDGAGHWRWIHSRGSVVARDRHNQPKLVAGTHVDITDRKRAEAEAHRLFEIIEATTDFVLTTDGGGFILYANAALLRLLGKADAAALRGRALHEFFPEATVSAMKQQAIPAAIAAGAWHGEVILRNAAGQMLPASQVALVHRAEETDAVTLSFVMRDVSQQKRIETEKIENERRMLLIQKTESLGVLAGGIAHDFNNLLTAMLGNASLIRLDVPEDSALQEPLQQIETAAERAAALCQQLLAYAGRSPLTFAEVDLTELIEETKQLVHVSIGRRTAIDLELARPLAVIRAAPSQMQQIVMNLALNAAEAIGEREGRITIRTRVYAFEAPELRKQFHGATLPAGNYVTLEVADTGAGMTPEVQARIFEPFFTTKFTGHGLGLAAVMGIVKSHGGAVQVTSEVGKGSLFRLIFPAVQGSTPPMAVEKTEVLEWRGAGLALVVDDEPSVRTLVARLLESFGFTTIVAVDGLDGVELFRRHAGELRFVLLDMTMPRLDGEGAFAEMHRIERGVPIVLMSGFSEKLTLDRFLATKPAGFLAKPFDRKTLQERLRALVRARDGAKAGREIVES